MIKVYKKFPHMKGYLFLNDDNFMKVWELEYLDFNIPWFYSFAKLHKKWKHYKDCEKIENVIENNIEWKKNLTIFSGFYEIPKAVSDFYYLPNNLIHNFFLVVEKMFNYNLFLECVVPSTMGIILFSDYQLIHFYPLYGKKRKNVINYPKNTFNQITIHPIKFSNILLLLNHCPNYLK